MGLTSALNTSVTGLSATQTEIGVIGNNVANAGSTGFKESNVTFATQLSNTLRLGSLPNSNDAGTNPMQVGLGAQVAQITPDLSQGTIKLSSSPSDLAIQGDGFFILQNAGIRGQVYSRDGNFHLDSAHSLTNNTGQKVMGYGVDNNFNLVTSTLTPLNIPLGALQVAQQTKNVQVTGALSPQGANATTTFRIYDSLGQPLDVRMSASMQSQSANKTTYGYTLDLINPSGPPLAIGSGTIDFDGQGRVSSAPTAQFAINDSTPGAVNPLKFTLDVSQVSGISSTGSTLSLANQDGAARGTLTSFTIGDKGVITGNFDNGVSRTLGQIAMARFPNPGGLVQTGDNNFAQGAASGLPEIDTPGTGGAGTVRAGALESSNTDLGKNLANMIVASTNFEGNAKAITSNSRFFDLLLTLRQ